MYPTHLANLKKDKVGQTMDSKHIVLSKSNHQHGNSSTLERIQFNIAEKKRRRAKRTCAHIVENGYYLVEIGYSEH